MVAKSCEWVKTFISCHSFINRISCELVVEIFCSKKSSSKLKMKVFELVQIQYETLGISPSNQLNQKYPFNERILFGFFLFGFLIPSQFVYIFYVADGFMDYMVSICSTSADTLTFVSFAAIVFRRSNLFECFDNI